MNKILLALGTTISIAIPIAMTMSCGSSTSEEVSVSKKVKEVNFDQDLLDKLNSIVDFGIKEATFTNNLRVSGSRKFGKITIKFKARLGNVLDVVGIGPLENALIVLSPAGTKEDPARVNVTVNGHKVNDEDPVVSKLAKELVPAIEEYQEITPNNNQKT